MILSTRIASFLLVWLLGAIVGVVVPFSVAQATNRIFLIDTSMSMRKNGLFERIVSTLKTDYIARMQHGEHMLILSFDDDVTTVVDRQFNDVEDRLAIDARIGNLKADGAHTWMSEALRLTVSQAQRLGQQYPEDSLNVYILTDGINDPPVPGEQRLEFPDLVIKHFKAFQEEYANVYLLLYADPAGASFPPSSEVSRIENETPISVGIPGNFPENPPLPAEITLRVQGLQHKQVNRGNLPATIKGHLYLRNVPPHALGKSIALQVYADPEVPPAAIRLTPDIITVESDLQQEQLLLNISNSVQDGRTQILLTFSSEELILTPRRFETSVDVVAPAVDEPVAPPLAALPKVKLHLVDVDQIRIDPSDVPTKHDAKLELEKVPPAAIGKSLAIRIEVDPHAPSEAVKISPTRITVNAEGQSEDLRLEVSDALPEGKHDVSFIFSSDELIVTPNRVESSIEVEGVPKVLKVLVVLFSVILLFVLLLLMRRKSIYLTVQDEPRTYEFVVTGFRKRRLEEVGLPNYELRFGTSPVELLSVACYQDSVRICDANPGNSERCIRPDGQEVQITFIAPRSQAKEGAEEERAPGINFESEEYKT